MTDTLELRVSKRLLDLLEHMLQEPKEWYYGLGVSYVTDMSPETARPLMRKLYRAGWATNRQTPASTGYGRPREEYRLTASGLRKATTLLKHHRAYV